MALKQTHTFFHTVEGILYEFTVNSEAPLAHLREVFMQWITDIGNIAANAQAQAEAQTKPIVPEPALPIEDKAES